MIEILALLCLAVAVILLIVLSAIDLKYWILPDELNFALGAAGVAFHLLTAYQFVTITQMLLGAAVGGGMLYIIRYFSNRHYGRDTLGLGDVKLLIAAGLWLGLDGTLEAITLGAAAGLVHGILYASYISLKYKKKFALAQLSIPAGPGFAVGIAAAGWFRFDDYVMGIIHGFIA